MRKHASKRRSRNLPPKPTCPANTKTRIGSNWHRYMDDNATESKAMLAISPSNPTSKRTRDVLNALEKWRPEPMVSARIPVIPLLSTDSRLSGRAHRYHQIALCQSKQGFMTHHCPKPCFLSCSTFEEGRKVLILRTNSHRLQCRHGWNKTVRARLDRCKNHCGFWWNTHPKNFSATS